MYRISGVAVSERDGSAVSRCHITANPAVTADNLPRGPRQRARTSDNTLSADCDSSGHFALTVPSAGNWQLYVSGRGFRRQGYERHENFFTGIVLTPAKPAYDVVFRAEPDVAITGVVLDEAGESVRNARVTLLAAEPVVDDVAPGPGQVRGSTVTDDRGHYEFADLAPGSYKVTVQAEPWYAAGGLGRRFGLATSSTLDPLLDVVYPQTWFPGATEREAAEPLLLHSGEVRQADFTLTPAPATHLRISTPPVTPGTQRGQTFPQVERVSSEGMPFVNTTLQVDPQGQIDVGGLSPGLYRVTMQGSGTSQSPAFIHVTGGSQRSLDLSASVPIANVTFHLQMEGDVPRLEIVLTDVDTGSAFVSYDQNNMPRRRSNTDAAAQSSGDRKLEVPSGRYRVTLAGTDAVFLSGMAVKSTSIGGRVVTLGSGDTSLDLKLTRGRASLKGITSMGGRALAGAMVMLVPATFGQAGSITVLRRDQSNSDGSFLIEGIIPGDYILLAIDHGWTVNWHDPATLGRYLVHGAPITLVANGASVQDLVAQTP